MPCIVESPVASTVGGGRLGRDRCAARAHERARAMAADAKVDGPAPARRRAEAARRECDRARQCERPARGRAARRRDAQPRPDAADAPAIDDADANHAPGLDAARDAQLEALRAGPRVDAVGAGRDGAVGQGGQRREAPHEAVAGPRLGVPERRRGVRLRVGRDAGRPQPLGMAADALVERDARALGVEEVQADDAELRRVRGEVVVGRRARAGGGRRDGRGGLRGGDEDCGEQR